MVLRARTRRAGFARGNGYVRQHCFARASGVARKRASCHLPEVSVVPVVPVRPLENEIPCGRPSHWMVAIPCGRIVAG